MKRILSLLLLPLFLTACAAEGVDGRAVPTLTPFDGGEAATLRLTIDGAEVPVTWEDNASVRALRALLPLTIQMSMYGGFEQVGPIGRSIARDDAQTATSPGDIVLYSGDHLVIFYGSNAWAYTRLGHIDLPEAEMRKLLGGGDVTVAIEEVRPGPRGGEDSR